MCGSRAVSPMKATPVPERRGVDEVGCHKNPIDVASTSYAEAVKSKAKHKSPWLHNDGNFDTNVMILNSDRIMP